MTKLHGMFVPALLLLALAGSAVASGGGGSSRPPLVATPEQNAGAVYTCPPGSRMSTCTLQQYKDIKAAIAAMLPNQNWDDGSLAGAFIRTAWHNCGTYMWNPQGKAVGGCAGAHMRAGLREATDGANAGLEFSAADNKTPVHDFLRIIQGKYPCITYADIWTLSGVVAFQVQSGGKFMPKWRPGRCDAPITDTVTGPEDGRLPDASFKTLNGTGESSHLRDVFYRMGWNDRGIVILSAIGHRMGRAHQGRSGFDGAWDHNAVNFDTAYLKNLMGNDWGLTTQMKNSLSGQLLKNLNLQYVNNRGQGNIFMLPTDLALRQDKSFADWVNYYIQNENAFLADGAFAFTRLMEQGVNFLPQYANMYI